LISYKWLLPLYGKTVYKLKISELKILEIASVLAGPQVGSFFSELGATVTKVENKTTGGDVTRNWRLSSEKAEHSISAYYASANYNKRVQFLDFKDAEDYETLVGLIQESDILISNFKAGDAQKFKLAYEDCKKINPNIIYGEITGFGKDVKRTAFDVILQAETGYISMTGTAESTLSKLPVAFIDLFAAHQLKEGILVALLEGWKPVCVSVSLYDSAIASLANQASNYLMENHIPKPIGTQHPNIAPYGDIFITQDNKKVILAVGSEKQFASLMELLDGVPISKSFASNQLRVENRSELNQFLTSKIENWESSALFDACIEQNIPIGRVHNLKEVFEKPESDSLILEEVQEGKNTKKVKTAVFTFS
tara:strand:- start:15489 stop:16589 length:1101 start_codon:yes stop_codon:yes gene_type:complete